MIQLLFFFAVPPPPAVSDIQAIPRSPHLISVSWVPPQKYGFEIVYYQVTYRKNEKGSTTYVNSTLEHIEITGLEPETSYLIGVTAVSSDSHGMFGPEIEATTLRKVRLEPVNVSAVRLNSSDIQINWKPPINIDLKYLRGFRINYRKENSTVTSIFVQNNKTNSFIFSLEDNASYDFRVWTLMTWSQSAPSEWITLHRQLELGKPRKLTAMIDLDSVILSWDSPEIYGRLAESDELAGFQVNYSLYGDPTSLTSLIIPNDTNEVTLKGLGKFLKWM